MKQYYKVWVPTGIAQGEPVNAVSQWDANYKPPASTFTTNTSEPTVINIQDEKMEIEIDNCETVEKLTEWKKSHEVLPGKILTHYLKRLTQLRPVEF